MKKKKKRQVKWSGIPISWRIFQFIVIHTGEGFGVVNKAEIDVFLGKRKKSQTQLRDFRFHLSSISLKIFDPSCPPHIAVFLFY